MVEQTDSDIADLDALRPIWQRERHIFAQFLDTVPEAMVVHR